MSNIRNETNDPEIIQTLNNLMKLYIIYSEEKYGDYGLSKKDSDFKLHCLSPKLAFESLTDENPANILITSGTLPDIKVTNEICGLNLSTHNKYTLKNKKNLTYLSLKTHINNGHRLELSYREREKGQ